MIDQDILNGLGGERIPQQLGLQFHLLDDVPSDEASTAFHLAECEDIVCPIKNQVYQGALHRVVRGSEVRPERILNTMKAELARDQRGMPCARELERPPSPCSTHGLCVPILPFPNLPASFLWCRERAIPTPCSVTSHRRLPTWAHEPGRQLVSSEICTWLRENWHTALSHEKLELDQFFLHIFAMPTAVKNSTITM